MHLIRQSALLFFLLLTGFTGIAQIPTVQDCLGAIPVCQEVYFTEQSYIGSGNYPNEINPDQVCPYSCMDGEKNDVWYIITVQNSGIVRFTITPNDPNDDYDWAVYSLNGFECYQIYNDAIEMQASCNAYGNLGYNGPTGASTAMGGTTNCQNGGLTNKWNIDIPVSTGETYVMCVSNWSQSQYGYTLDFSASTASIFDNVKPYISEFQETIGCAGETSLYFDFSENVKCSTVQPSDFELKDASGFVYTITDVIGDACEVGGTQEKRFTLIFNPPIMNGGDYKLKIVGPIQDLCDNIANSTEYSFTLVEGLPPVDFTGLYPFWCVNEDPDTLYGNHYPETGNGTFEGPGITDLGNNSAQFDPGAAGVGGPYSITYTYTDAGGCSNSISRLVTVRSLPIQFPVGGGGAYCEGSLGPEVYLDTNTSEAFVNYELFLNGVTTGQVILGTGVGGINFGHQEIPGTYTIKAYGNCGSSDMLGSAEIIAALVPAVFDVSGGGNYCENEDGVSVLLSGSEEGVTYELLLDSLSTGTVLQGNGGPLSFDHVTFPGSYSVYAYNEICSDTMAGSVEVGIYPVPAADAGADQTIPYGTWTTLDGSGSGGTPDYTWHWEPANMLIDPDVENPMTVNMTATTIFYLTITDDNGCQDEDDMKVTVTGGPLGVEVTAEQESLCLGVGTYLHALASGGSGTYTYDWVSNPPGFTSTSSDPYISPQVTTEYTVTINDGYNTVEGSITITVKPLPGAQASADQTDIPYGSWTTLHALATAGVGPYTYQWSPPDKVLDPTSQNPTTVHLDYSVLYTVTITDQGTSCSDDASVEVTVHGGPLQIVSVTADPDQMCNTGAVVQLSGVVAGGTETYTYSWSSNPPGFSSDILNPVVYPTQTTTYTLSVYDGNATVSSSVTVTVHPLPVANAGDDDSIPYGTWTVLHGSATGGSGTYGYQWQPAVLLVNPNIQNPQTVNMTGSAIFTLKVTDYYGCTDEDEMVLSVTGGPLGVNVYAQPEEICRDEETEISALAYGGSESYQYTWTDESGTVISHNVSVTVSPTDTTTYHVNVSDGYNSVNGSVTVFVDPLPSIDLTAGTTHSHDTIMACVYDTIILDAGNPGCQYEWSDQSWGRTLRVGTTGIGFDIQSYWVKVTNPLTGCRASDSVTVVFSFALCTGLIQPQKDIFVKIYPNPTSGQFTIAISGIRSDLSLEILDMTGTAVKRDKISAVNNDGTGKCVTHIDLAGRAKGIYLVKLFNDAFFDVEKLVVN